MAGLGPHAGFIIAAYLATLVVIAALILWVTVDGARLRRRIAALDAAGIRRRSASTDPKP